LWGGVSYEPRIIALVLVCSVDVLSYINGIFFFPSVYGGALRAGTNELHVVSNCDWNRHIGVTVFDYYSIEVKEPCTNHSEQLQGTSREASFDISGNLWGVASGQGAGKADTWCWVEFAGKSIKEQKVFTNNAILAEWDHIGCSTRRDVCFYWSNVLPDGSSRNLLAQNLTSLA
jgi:hypothetical protein